MITISLCMIVRNEENHIERCLNSVKNVIDEIIIVDTGSTDQTKKICAKFTDKIYDFQWIDDFSAARNYSYSFATMDYIMWMDADDILLPEDNLKLTKLKENLSPDIASVMMKYNTGIDKNGHVVFSYYRERLTKRDPSFRWMEPVHEFLQFYGRTINSDIAITHGKSQDKQLSTRNINIYEKLINNGESLSPRGVYYYARELRDHKRYADAVVQFEKFLDTGLGWKEDNICACNELAKCYQQLKQHNKVLPTLFRTFQYDLPRGETCCYIGYYYKELQDYKSAAFWFELVLSLKIPRDSWGFIQSDFWGYIPSIECAVCYDRLGDYVKANDYNNLALKLNPDSLAALNNQSYFKTKLKQE